MTESYGRPLMGVELREPGVTGPVPGWIAWPLRVTACCVAVLVFVQPVTAGLFVTGQVGMLRLHSANGTVLITTLVLFQVIAAVLVWRPGYGPAPRPRRWTKILWSQRVKTRRRVAHVATKGS